MNRKKLMAMRKSLLSNDVEKTAAIYGVSDRKHLYAFIEGIICFYELCDHHLYINGDKGDTTNDLL